MPAEVVLMPEPDEDPPTPKGWVEVPPSGDIIESFNRAIAEETVVPFRVFYPPPAEGGPS